MRDALPDADGRALVVGVGNELRGDDAVGLEVARRVRERLPDAAVVETEGEPTRLLDLWDGSPAVVVVDAATGTGDPGTVTVFDAAASPLPQAFFGTSTHHFSLGEAVELGRALGRLPARVHVVAVEGAQFETGAPLSPAVAAAIPNAVEEVVRCTSGS